MSQAFSLYTELTVRQNLDLHAGLFSLPPDKIPARIADMAERFDLNEIMDTLPDALPLGIRQKIVARRSDDPRARHSDLDEPTSGVDPVARDGFWQILSDLSRKDGVTIFVSTHFMNEAELCDRISLMHAGKVLVSDTPRGIIEKRSAGTLEEAFISYLEEAIGDKTSPASAPIAQREEADEAAAPRRLHPPARLSTYAVCSPIRGGNRSNCAGIRSARRSPFSAASF